MILYQKTSGLALKDVGVRAELKLRGTHAGQAEGVPYDLAKCHSDGPEGRDTYIANESRYAEL